MILLYVIILTMDNSVVVVFVVVDDVDDDDDGDDDHDLLALSYRIMNILFIFFMYNLCLKYINDNDILFKWMTDDDNVFV